MGMIAFQTALRLVEQHVPLLERETLSLFKSLGRVLAENVHTPIPLPVGDNSAMDGFVFRSRDTHEASSAHPVILKIQGTVKAGDSAKRRLRPKTAYSIMTGAFLPEDGDTVLPIEKAVVEGRRLILRQPVLSGRNVRYKGEELKKCRLALSKDTDTPQQPPVFQANLQVDIAW